ncbi:hypothetical protein ACFXTN_025242 [Malus domestica]
MSANEYYRMFTDLSRYDMEVAANLVEMLRRFILGSKKKWRSIATSTHCATYQEFYEVLLQIEDLENMPSESEDEEGNNGNQRRDDKGNRQAFQGLLKTQNLKRSGGGSGAPLCRIYNIRLFGECRRCSSGCFTCGQMGHRAAQCPQRQHQYSQDPQYQSGYPQYQGGFMSYQPYSAGGSQWYQGGQPQQGEIAASSARSSRQSGPQRQGHDVHANRGRGA